MNIIVFTLLVSFTLSVVADGDQQHGHEVDQDFMHSPHSRFSVGQPAETAEATKTINVELLDAMRFAFSPALDIESGDIVRFVVINTGQIRHEFSIGNAEEQKMHAEMMRKIHDMVHEDANTITVEPGETKEITWHFMIISTKL